MLPKRLERKAIFESKRLNLFSDRVLMPSGEIIEEYLQLEHTGETVVILMQNKKSEVCMIRSLRYTTQKIEWELPAGGIEKGEDIISAARREVKEETGLQLTDPRKCYWYNPSNGISNETVHIVFGGVADGDQSGYDNDEVQEIHWLSLVKIITLLAANEICDGVSLLPILLLINDTSR